MSNIKKTKPVLDAMQSAEDSYKFFQLMEKYKGATDQEEALLSAFVCGGVAEFIAANIALRIENIFSQNCFGGIQGDSKLTIKFETQNTNLEATMRRIQRFTFEDQEKLLKVLERIKNARNVIFHGFIDANTWGRDTFKEIRELETAVDELILIWKGNEFLK